MSDSLTTLISKVQATLGDDGTYFTTAIVTAAARQALRELNEKYSVNAGTLIETDSTAYEYVLNDTDFNRLTSVVGVWLNDTNGDDDTPLNFTSFFEDNVPVVRLKTKQAANKFLLIRFTEPQTINGLDSETASSLPAWIDPLLVDGIAYHSIQVRGVSRVETNNLDKATSDNYREYADRLKAAWDSGLAKLASNAAPSSRPDTSAWNDEWHERSF